jgi:hypothetical protein
MASTKLTLKVDSDVIARAKRYADTRGTSVSRLVEGFLRFLTESGDAEAVARAPVLRRLRGSLARGKGSGDERP